MITSDDERLGNLPVVETCGVSRTYGSGETRVEALREVSLQIVRGEIVAIMGPSGSGKSTLLNLLGAIDSPTSGQIFLEGVDVSTLDDTQRTLIRRRRLGFIFQAFNLLPILTAIENVALPLELDGVSAAEARRRALLALQQVGMEHRREHLPGMLSGGEQQRVAVARALVIQPALLLADEPTGNLDTTNGRRIMELFRELVNQHDQTMLIVTHDEGIAAAADRVIRLRDGRVEAPEEPHDGAVLASRQLAD